MEFSFASPVPENVRRESSQSQSALILSDVKQYYQPGYQNAQTVDNSFNKNNLSIQEDINVDEDHHNTQPDTSWIEPFYNKWLDYNANGWTMIGYNRELSLAEFTMHNTVSCTIYRCPICKYK